jgi:hypothetical protein
MSLLSWLFGARSPQGQGAAVDVEARNRRQAEWETALASNRVPGFVEERLRAAANRTTPWVSTMTPAELLMAKHHGIEPVAMVSGSCWFHFGYSWTLGHAEGWHRALARIRHEAASAGANAVIDVEMRRIPLQFGSSMDFTLVGTAVRVKGLPPSAEPIISTVPGLEFVRLLQAGIVPVGMAIGAYYEWLPRKLGLTGGWTVQNKPLPELSAFYQGVRRKALNALRNDGLQQGGGVLAPVHFGQLMEGDKDSPGAFLGRYIAIGTVMDSAKGASLPQGIRTVVDMRDADSPLTGGERGMNTVYESNEESGGI